MSISNVMTYLIMLSFWDRVYCVLAKGSLIVSKKQE